MSRGQMEIFGLVIVVLLVTIGLLFAVFVLTRPPSTEVSQISESVTASNFLSTIFSTSAIGCGKRTVRNLVQDCAISGANAAVCENGMTTCTFAKEIIAHMLDSTLGRWGKDYEFAIDGPASVRAISVKTSLCTGEVEAASRPEKIRPGLDVMVILKLCR